MALAAMLSVDRDAVICDMAQTYGVLEMNKLPARLAATLAAGMPADSRIMLRLQQMPQADSGGEIMAFDTAEDFIAARAAAIGGGCK